MAERTRRRPRSPASQLAEKDTEPLDFFADSTQKKESVGQGWARGRVGELEAFRDGKSLMTWSGRLENAASFSYRGPCAKELNRAPPAQAIFTEFGRVLFDYAQAQDACASLRPAGRWRLPTLHEFREARNLPEKEGEFWTSTAGSGADAYQVFAGLDVLRSADLSVHAFLPAMVRCVLRGAEKAPEPE